LSIGKPVHQGHLYAHGRCTNEVRVLAMESGAGTVRVREIDPAEPLGIGRAYVVRADWLRPLPMKYFGGQIP
jgi:hypothetical protein